MSIGENVGLSVGERIASSGMGIALGTVPTITDVLVASGSNLINVFLLYGVTYSGAAKDGFIVQINNVNQSIVSTADDLETGRILFTLSQSVQPGDSVRVSYSKSTGTHRGRVTAVEMEDSEFTKTVPSAPAQGVLFFDDFRGGSLGSPVTGSGSYPSQKNISVVSGGALTGNYVARMRFLGVGSAPFAEFNFKTSVRTKDVWTKIVVKVPSNYAHLQNAKANTSANNKAWVWAWSGSYKTKSQTDGVKLGGHLWRKSNGYSEFVAYRRYVRHEGGGFVTKSKNYNSSSDGTSGKSGNGVVAADKGTWIEIITRFKTSSSKTANDGIHEMWKRSANGNLEKQINIHNGDWWSTDADGSPEKGMDTFRFLGATNDNVYSTTDWLIDSVTVSTGSLL